MRGYPGLTGLTLDTRTNTFYAVDQIGDQLMTVDPDTGVAQRAAPLPRRGIADLFFDPASGRLLAWDSITTDYLSIATGGSGDFEVLATGVSNIAPLVFHDLDAVWYSLENSDDLYSFDPTTGAKTFLGDLTGFATYNSLAYDSAAQVVRANAGSDVYTIVPAAFTATLEVPFNPFPTTQLRSLTYQPSTDTLFGLDLARDELVTLDIGGASAASRGGHADPSLERLVYDPAEDCFYTVSGARDELMAVDPETGRARSTVPIGLTSVAALAFDTVARELYAIETGSSSLLRIDPPTGTTTFVGALPAPDFRGLAFAGAGGTLFGVTAGGEVWEIDPTDASSAFVFFTSNTDNRGLTWDPVNERLVSFDAVQGLPVEIDPAAPSDAALAGVASIVVEGLAWDTKRERFVAFDAFATQLVTLDLEAPSAVTLGEVGVGLDGLAYDSRNQLAYSYDVQRRSLVTVDVPAARAIASVVTDVDLTLPSLAHDSDAGVLYAVYELAAVQRLGTVDPSTGVVTDIGALGLTGASGLAYDTRERRLLTVVAGNTLATIDPTTGLATAQSVTLANGLSGLCYDRLTGWLVGHDLVNRRFVRVDRGTGALEPLGESVAPLFALGGWRR
ncbi:hypothetical protein [Planctomycetes bacterium Pla163]|uniref:hypothetical protein n=1 Tax=Rohdeia mirabilis TaxID=2528008 RepID=UPI0011A67F50